MFTVNFKNSKKSPLYLQLYEHVKGAIGRGELMAGAKLPSKRELASHLKLSVITVENAYMQLIAEGYVYSRPGSGYYVEKLYRDEKENRTVKTQNTSEKSEIFYDFKTSGVDIYAFPFSVWAKLAREVLSEQNEELLNACPPQGTLKLREQISSYLKSFRGIDVNPDRIIVGAGTEYLTGLIIQILGRDNAYGVENPGYDKVYKIFSANTARVFPVPMDEKGAVAHAISGFGINVIHVTPSHHFPLGIVMPISRRLEVLDWAEEKDGRYIIEDDYDSDFRYFGKPVPALRSLNGNKVVYVNTFAKTLAPSIRIGFTVLPDELYKQYQTRLGFYSCTVPVFEQLTLAKFIEKGHLERHIGRMKKIYRQKRDLLIQKITGGTLGRKTEIFGSDAGMHVLLKVNNGMNGEQLLSSAESVGVKVYGLRNYYSFPVSDMPDNVVVMGYSGLSEKQISEGVAALENVW